MRKIYTVILVLLIYMSIATLCGCEKGNNTPPTQTITSSSISPVSTTEKPTIETPREGSFLARVVEKPSDGVLTVKVIGDPSFFEKYGETVYVTTDQSNEWCIDDDIWVYFFESEIIDSTPYVTVIADRISSHIPVYKPIIYLYPEIPTKCSVKLDLNGILTCTYPDYEKYGWNDFIAHPDGTLVFDDGKEYYALYWEGVQNADWDFSKGFCVRGEDTAEFLEWVLGEQGLTRREANEFIVYWLPLMENNEYNVISFQMGAYTDGAKLTVTPAPDSFIRVFMAYYPSDVEIEIEAQEFEKVERKGFTVVEWGGSEISSR